MSDDKAAVQRDLQEAWDDLEALVNGLSSGEMEEPGIVEGWSVKDLLGHMAFWSGRAAETLRAINAGRPDDIPFGTGDSWVDEWNQREYLVRKDRPLDAVRSEWLRKHAQAQEALAETPAEKLRQAFHDHRVVDYFIGDTHGHYREHTAQIREWLRQLETTEA